jgi:hypothetical protein
LVHGAVDLAKIPLLILLLLMPSIMVTYGDNFNAGLFAIESKPYGYTYGDWSAKWWQWILGTPESKSPLGDPTGKYCAEGQDGPVWYLAGFNGKTERSCNVPSGKAIFVPIINTECSYAEYPEFKSTEMLLNCAIEEMKDTKVEVTLDGTPLTNLENYRAQAPSFNVTFPSNAIFGAPAGPTVAAADGYYLMLEPLPSGTHKLNIKGVDTDFVSDVTYTLTVK